MAVIRWALATIQVINGDDATRRVFRDLRRDPSHKRVARRSPDALHEGPQSSTWSSRGFGGRRWRRARIR